jgi:hypothetical protein
LTYLAATIYPEPRLRAGVNRDWLQSSIWEFFRSQLTEDRDLRARRAAKTVVDSITARTWVMTETGSDNYEFTHRTFLEFFFGRYLQDEYQTTEELIKALVPRIYNAEWNVPCHVAIQLKIGNSSSAVTSVARRLVSEFGQPENTTGIAAGFLIQTFEYLPAAEPELEKMAKFVTTYTAGTDEWSAYLASMLRTSAPRRAAIYRGISQGIKALMETYDPKALGRICDWIYEVRLQEQYPSSGIPTEQALEFAKVFARVAGSWFQKNEPAALVKARFDVLRELDEANVAIYGPRLWSALPYSRNSWILVDFHLMLAQLLEVMLSPRDLESQPYAKLGLAIAPTLRTSAPFRILSQFELQEIPFWLPPISWAGLQNIVQEEIGIRVGTVALAYLELFGTQTDNVIVQGKTVNKTDVTRSICSQIISTAADDTSFYKAYLDGHVTVFY